jgi:hypothetical protein
MYIIKFCSIALESLEQMYLFSTCFRQHIGLEQIVSIDIGRGSKIDRIGRTVFF